jgi:hypothetical protein
MTDFTVQDHGTIWIVSATSDAARDRISYFNEWATLTGDWRATWHFCQELFAEGFSFEASSPTAQKLIEEGRPW